MSNIDRRYSYHDDGVLPSEGEYGVTYLTLYSSGAGNCYDGWIWDPDHRTTESETERTFGYRNPDYTDYCWDDEVIVDLSNPQSREESEFEQGRITSYNTNVSSAPIFLSDIDVTGMDEDEREANATTVLFSAIPLVKDAYIHAEVEVAMKMNISPDNTDGRVRIEAFYIINDDSDRTMRPHPIHHYSISENDEYNLLRLLYWNPALKHDTNNYIGVKLICSGGTAEIGISDDPDYGDAIITLTSAGLVGDTIYKSDPATLTITGKSKVPYKYKFDPSDYTVICTYTDGTEVDVTNDCEFVPSIGTEITGARTITAYYKDLTASINITLLSVDHIELSGLDMIYGEYYFDLANYTVMAIFEDESEWDITDDQYCTYSIASGTLINQDTTLTVTYRPIYMTGSTFTDSMQISVVNREPKATGTVGGLTYTAYEDEEYGTDALIVITGNSYYSLSASGNPALNSYSRVAPTTVKAIYNYIHAKHEVQNPPSGVYYDVDGEEMTYVLKWQAKGDIYGIYFGGDIFTNQSSWIHGENVLNQVESYYGFYPTPISSNKRPWFNSTNYICKKTIGFEKVKMVPRYKNFFDRTSMDYKNPIQINLCGQIYLTNYDIPFLYKINFDDVEGRNTVISSGSGLFYDNDATEMFANCVNLVSISFLQSWPLNKIRELTRTNCMFFGLEKITDFSVIKKWYLPNVYGACGMFARSGIRYFPFTQLYIGHLSTNYDDVVEADGMFAHCHNLIEFPAKAFLGGDSKHKYEMAYMFTNCYSLSNISPMSSWSGLDVIEAQGMFCNARVSVGIGSINTLKKICYCKSPISRGPNAGLGIYQRYHTYDYAPYSVDQSGVPPRYWNDWDWYIPFIGKRSYDFPEGMEYVAPDIRNLKRSDYEPESIPTKKLYYWVMWDGRVNGGDIFIGIPSAKCPQWYNNM